MREHGLKKKRTGAQSYISHFVLGDFGGILRRPSVRFLMASPDTAWGHRKASWRASNAGLFRPCHSSGGLSLCSQPPRVARFQTFGGRSPHRASEDVAYSVARFFQTGGTFQNYYMYHGGTNFGRTAGGPFIITSYDYDAPIDEYGNIKQPKWGHLKQLHSALKLSEHALTHGLRKTIPLGHHLQTGLKGETLQIYSDTGAMNVEWNSGINPPEYSALTWYKTEFNAPDGHNPVALDLSSMTKGQAWVNGMNIGRYWASYSSPKDGCTTCDYKGPYSPTKCTSKCGQPSQTRYHVPRSLLRPTGNSLVLLEEIGGIPSGISFGTKQVDTICGHVSQSNPNPKFQLKCSSGQRIASVTFASFGNPEGLCGNSRKGSCNARNSSFIVEEACLGREECTLTVSDEIFGNPCEQITKSLSVEAVCRY